MRRLAVIHATDGEYIKEALSFFRLQELKKGGDRDYLAVAWGNGEKSWRVWTIDSRFEVREEVREKPPDFQEAVILG